MQVLASTDDVPGLADLIKRRRELDIDHYDEVWEGVYRVVNTRHVDHQEVLSALTARYYDPARALGCYWTGVNIGLVDVNNRVPDLALVPRDTPRTSPAFFSTALMVVEILSPGEKPGLKLDFYAQWNVNEYLEIDRRKQRVSLLANRGGEWLPIEASEVFELTVADVVALLQELGN
ncbi:MAG TPA: Uma2 family endonuclease [Ilumatobacter sp.]|nr:Uma2 family endonuclease [Ilumatobacter sp.]